MKKIKNIFLTGAFYENPTFIGFLGMCPTLATTNSLSKAVGMALATIIVLVLSNFFISLIKSITPAEVRIPVYVIVIATLVKTLELMLAGFVPSIYESLGVFLPLIVVNCIVLGRAEAFASKSNPGHAVIDGLGSGVGFLLALSLIGFVREFLGTGGIEFVSYFDSSVKWISFSVIPGEYVISLLTQPMGAFLTLGLLAGTITGIRMTISKRKANAAKLAAGK